MECQLPEIPETFQNTKIENLWYLYREYMDSFVVGNRELKQIMFHVLLGTILTRKGISYIESGKNKSTRIHLFILQSSGTGKSEVMKAIDNLLIGMNIPSEYTIKFNEAALTGTIYLTDKGGITAHKGALAHLNSLFWDEGSVMLKGSAYMDVLTDVLQGVMDEPGYVCKGMRLGVLKYPTATTVVAGSYIFDEFKDTILTSGFLQRMFVSWKVFTDEEKANMRKGVNMLKTVQNKQRIEQLVDAFRTFDKNMVPPSEDGTVLFDKDAVVEFTRELETSFREDIEKQYIGSKQEVLETFFNRVHAFIDRIAVQVAVINGKSMVGMAEMQYAKEISRYHLLSVMNFLDTIRTDVSDETDRRRGIIIKIINDQGGKIQKTTLVQSLLLMKRSGKWDYGSSRTINFIDKMVKDADLRLELDGKHNTKSISVRK